MPDNLQYSQRLRLTPALSADAKMQASKLTLYSYPLAFNPQKARLAIVEKGVAGLAVQNVNLFNGESLKPWFMKINPGSTVPVLAVGAGSEQRVIRETMDILKYVDELGDGPLGGDKVDRALVNDLVSKLHGWDGNLYAMANVDPSAKGVLATLSTFRTRVAQAQKAKAEKAGDAELASQYNAKVASIAKSSAELQDPALIETNRKELVQLLDEAEKLLEKSKFLAGPAYSMADVVMSTILFRIGTVNQTKLMLEPRPKLSTYYKEIKTRPSFPIVFGPAISTWGQVSNIVPALFKAKLANLTGWYA